MRMNTQHKKTPAGRRSANLTIDAAVLAKAKALGVNISRAAEQGVATAVAQARAAQWRKDNAAAINGWNDYVERHGLPLAKYRQF